MNLKNFLGKIEVTVEKKGNEFLVKPQKIVFFMYDLNEWLNEKMKTNSEDEGEDQIDSCNGADDNHVGRMFNDPRSLSK